MKYELRKVPLEHVRLDGGTQPREEINQDAVDDYAQSMLDGHEFPPVVLYFDGETYWLGDGFHRCLAAQQAKRKAILADVRKGDKRDAILHSVGANAQHGQRRTNGDKRRAVTTLLKDAEWAKWSDREIARRCQVSTPLVGSVRAELKELSVNSYRYAQRNGTTYTLNVEAIGATPEPEEEVEIPAHLITAFNALPRAKQAEVLEQAREQARRRAEKIEAEEAEESRADLDAAVSRCVAKLYRYLLRYPEV